MRHLLFFTVVTITSIAATSSRDYRTLRNEPAPTSVPVPVAGVRASQIRDTWGDARSEGRSHEGVDIFAKRGTPVLSATHGVISSVAWRTRGGNSVFVEGPGGYRHYYAHLDSYGRYEAGDWVEAGDTLGFVGTTGNAEGTSPHLHYGIYTEDGAINPHPLLADVKRPAASARATAPATPDAPRSEETTSRRNSRGVRTSTPPSSAPSHDGHGTSTNATARRRR